MDSVTTEDMQDASTMYTMYQSGKGKVVFHAQSTVCYGALFPPIRVRAEYIWAFRVVGITIFSRREDKVVVAQVLCWVSRNTVQYMAASSSYERITVSHGFVPFPRVLSASQETLALEGWCPNTTIALQDMT